MSYLIRLISIVVGSSIVFYGTASLGLSATEVAKIAKEATVKIESDSSQGSGEIIQQQAGQYFVLTAAHVVRNSEVKYAVVTADNRRYPLSPTSIQMLPGVDLAVVKFTSDRRYLVPKLGDANTAIEGTTTYVSGFPNGTEAIDVSVFSFTDGKVTANSSRPLKDGYSIIYTNGTLPGMSGGGVFNDRGELVAIHGKGDVDTKIQTSEINPNIRVKTGFNLGIPINTFQQLSAKIGLNTRLKPIVTNNTPTADDFILSGFERVSKSDLAGSVVAFSKAIGVNPKLVTPRFWRGTCKLLMGDAQDAIEDLTATIAVAPNKIEAYMYRGSAYAKLGEKAKAIADLDKAVSLNPRSDIAYGNRCALKFGLRDFTGAITDCNRAIQLNPQNSFYYSSRGSAYYQLNRYSQALADQNTAIQKNPQDKILYLNRGLVKSSLGDNKGALSDFNITIKSKYTSEITAEIYNARARVKNELKDRRGAIADFTESVEVLPDNSQTHFFRGYTYFAAGNLLAAITDLDRAIKLNSKFVEAYLLRGVIYNETKNSREAIEDFNVALMLNPNLSAAILSNRGISKFNLSDKQGALADFDRAISIDRDVPKAYYYRALLKVAVGNKQGAIADLQMAAKLYSTRKDNQKYQLAIKKIAELQRAK